MKTLLAHILASALLRLRRAEEKRGDFTSQTNWHEPNLSFHLANELVPYLFWLDCDFDMTKSGHEDKRPDIIFHRRGTNNLNFLVIEVKREGNRSGIEGDLEKIRNEWFAGSLLYRFGAGIITDERANRFEVHLLERGNDEPMVISSEDILRKFPRPRPSRAARTEIRSLASQARDATGDHLQALKTAIDERVQRVIADQRSVLTPCPRQRER